MTDGSEPGAAAATVEVFGLSKRYDDSTRVLDEVDLSVGEGEIVALVGANGAGKSTLLRCLVRLLEPTSGRVVIGGTDVTAARRRALRHVRADVGFVVQRFQLVPRLSAFHNVLHGAMGRRGGRCALPALAPEDVRAEAMECLDRVGLGPMASRRVDQLSGGQQQRVAIARMLLQRPLLVLADEPVASLDPVAGISVMELLREIAAERGLTVIVALHQLELALTFTHRIVGLRQGRVVLDRGTARCVHDELRDVYALAPG